MNAENPIAIPWKVRWRYWRHSLLPVVCFIGSAIFVVWFWQRQASSRQVVGEVTAIRVDVRSPVNGIVVDLPHGDGQWSMLDSVMQGDVIALVQPLAYSSVLSPESQEIEESTVSVYAPINGRVLQIHCWPDQSAQAFQPIMTISADQAKYILAYVPERVLGDTQEGTPVTVSYRIGQPEYPGSVSCMVERVGSSLEQIPKHHLQNSTVPQWGIPVRIKLPLNVLLRPGSLIDVIFPSDV